MRSKFARETEKTLKICLERPFLRSSMHGVGRRVLAIAVVFVTSVGIGGCADNKAEACAASMPQPACDAAPDLSDAASVSQMRVVGPAPQLESQALRDGRYVLTAETEYCDEDFTPVSQALPQQVVIEISGCVMRLNAEIDDAPQSFPGQGATISSQGTFTFSYAGGGLLNLNAVCPAGYAGSSAKKYGFDGTTLQLADTSDDSDGHGHSYTCEVIDSFERR